LEWSEIVSALKKIKYGNIPARDKDYEVISGKMGLTDPGPSTAMTGDVIATRKGLRTAIRNVRAGGQTGMTYDEQGNALFGRERRKNIRSRVKGLRQSFREYKRSQRGG
jgi:alkyl hydroperoxide reductase subunit AhpF